MPPQRSGFGESSQVIPAYQILNDHQKEAFISTPKVRAFWYVAEFSKVARKSNKPWHVATRTNIDFASSPATEPQTRPPRVKHRGGVKFNHGISNALIAKELRRKKRR